MLHVVLIACNIELFLKVRDTSKVSKDNQANATITCKPVQAISTGLATILKIAQEICMSFH